jgi:hypothetical protein
MKVLNEIIGSVTNHYRTAVIEDGPVIGAGDSYVDGTFFRVEKIRIKWIDDKPAATVSLFGPRTNADGSPYVFQSSKLDTYEHQLNLPVERGFPDWLIDFITENNFYVALTDGGHRRR